MGTIMRYRLLSSNGEVHQVDEQWISKARKIGFDHDPKASDLNAGELNAGENKTFYDADSVTTDNPVMLIEFQSFADGRAFSLAAEFRETRGNNSSLYAFGQLNPDQLTLAFQCGFSGVVVDEPRWTAYGESAWLQGLKPLVDRGYVPGRWSAVDSIWKQRSDLLQ